MDPIEYSSSKNPNMKRVLPSLQGEHVFNALGSLVDKLIEHLKIAINEKGSEQAVAGARTAIMELESYSKDFTKNRDHPEFRAASKGDFTNASKYSRFSASVEAALKDLIPTFSTKEELTGVYIIDPSYQTRGHTELSRFLDNLEDYTIDKKAKDSKLKELAPKRQEEFKRWFAKTEKLMYLTFKAVLNAALAVNKTHTT